MYTVNSFLCTELVVDKRGTLRRWHIDKVVQLVDMLVRQFVTFDTSNTCQSV